jgi:hypothetical protein
MLHTLLILLVMLLILGGLVYHPRIAAGFVLTLAGLVVWFRLAHLRELPAYCAELRESSNWDEAFVEQLDPDCKNVGRDGVTEKRAAYLRSLPQLCARLREEKNGDELSVEWANPDCKGEKG